MMRFRFSTSSKHKKKKDILISNSEDFGSKEEVFFDSQAWIDSDCEDDFYSVGGDTPRASFSDQQNSSTENPQLNKSRFTDKAPDINNKSSPTSPTDKKKLSELLKESLGGDELYEDLNKPNAGLETKPEKPVQSPKPSKGITHLFTALSRSTSSRSSERTPNRFSKSEKEISNKTTQCCLPKLITSLSFSERKKKPTSDFSDGG